MSVEWEEDALDRLADIYVALPNQAERDALAEHVDRMNTQLARDPWSPGESRGQNVRVWFAHPLMIGYALPPGGGVVVFHVVRLKGTPDPD